MYLCSGRMYTCLVSECVQVECTPVFCLRAGNVLQGCWCLDPYKEYTAMSAGRGRWGPRVVMVVVTGS